MLRKAVKLRHCPATVSAPAHWPVLSVRAGNQPGFFRQSRRSHINHCMTPPLGVSVGRWLEEAQVRRPVLAPPTRLRSEGNEGAFMPDSAQFAFRHFLPRVFPRAFALFLLAGAVAVSPAASIRGTVTDTSGAKVTAATVVLISGGKPAGTDISKADGSFQILSGIEGRFFLVVSATSFRQLETPGFYAGRLDSIERNVLVEPERVRR